MCKVSNDKNLLIRDLKALSNEFENTLEEETCVVPTTISELLLGQPTLVKVDETLLISVEHDSNLLQLDPVSM